MDTKDENRKKTLDHMIDERFAEIFFLAKEEFDIKSNSTDEQRLYDLLGKFNVNLKKRCKEHFGEKE